MVHMLNAFTEELDDAGDAVAGLLSQLDLAHRQKSNTIGLFYCPEDFWDEGIVQALQKALPFETVGVTTPASACEYGDARMALTLSVLTSDEAKFDLSYAEYSSEKDVEERTRGMCADVLSKTPLADIKLLLALSAYPTLVTGDTVTEYIAANLPGVPVGGAQAFTHRPDSSGICSFVGGKRLEFGCAVVAVSGEVSVELRSVHSGINSMLKQNAIATKTVGSRIYGINGMQATKYLESQNFPLAALVSMPFIITMDDGTKVARSCFPAKPEDEYLSCTGGVPEEAAINFAVIKENDVIVTADDVLKWIVDGSKDGGAALIFSCAVRQLALGSKYLLEFDGFRQALNEHHIPFSAMYAGGEFCPVENSSGAKVNRFHNCTLVAAILK